MREPEGSQHILFPPRIAIVAVAGGCSRRHYEMLPLTEKVRARRQAMVANLPASGLALVVLGGSHDLGAELAGALSDGLPEK